MLNIIFTYNVFLMSNMKFVSLLAIQMYKLSTQEKVYKKRKKISHLFPFLSKFYKISKISHLMGSTLRSTLERPSNQISCKEELQESRPTVRYPYKTRRWGWVGRDTGKEMLTWTTGEFGEVGGGKVKQRSQLTFFILSVILQSDVFFMHESRPVEVNLWHHNSTVVLWTLGNVRKLLYFGHLPPSWNVINWRICFKLLYSSYMTSRVTS